MKKLLLLSLVLLASQANAYEITLKFKCKEEAKQWVVWYLDGGGEQSSDYYASDFQLNNLITNDGVYVNKVPMLYLVQDKELNYGSNR